MNDDNLQRIGYALVSLDSSIRAAGILVLFGLLFIGVSLWMRR